MSSAFPRLTELDITGNLFSDWSEVARLAEELCQLKLLNVSHNRLSFAGVPDPAPTFATLQTLVLNSTCLQWHQVNHALLVPGHSLTWRSQAQQLLNG